MIVWKEGRERIIFHTDSEMSCDIISVLGYLTAKMFNFFFSRFWEASRSPERSV